MCSVYSLQVHELIQVECYQRCEGILVRYWYPVDMLERPPAGYRKSPTVGHQALSTANIHLHRYINSSYCRLCSNHSFPSFLSNPSLPIFYFIVSPTCFVFLHLEFCHEHKNRREFLHNFFCTKLKFCKVKERHNLKTARNFKVPQNYVNDTFCSCFFTTFSHRFPTFILIFVLYFKS